MKKLVLGSLAFAALASQTTGCSTSDEFATVDATWEIVELNADSTIARELECDVDITTVALHNQPITPSGAPNGDAFVDLFDCDAHVGSSAPLPPTVYQTFLSATNESGTEVFADSLAVDLDVRDVDLQYDVDFLDNGGYFDIGWRLKDADGFFNCNEQPGLENVDVVLTFLDNNKLIAKEVKCDLGSVLSQGLHEGPYSISLSAIDRASGDPIGKSPAVEKTINFQNAVTQVDVEILFPAP